MRKGSLHILEDDMKMDRDHPRFSEFVDRLRGPEGCDFHRDEQGRARWKCGGGRDQGRARQILEAMGDVDVDASLAQFTALDGACDCEIIFNAVPRMEELVVCA